MSTPTGTRPISRHTLKREDAPESTPARDRRNGDQRTSGGSTCATISTYPSGSVTRISSRGPGVPSPISPTSIPSATICSRSTQVARVQVEQHSLAGGVDRVAVGADHQLGSPAAQLRPHGLSPALVNARDDEPEVVVEGDRALDVLLHRDDRTLAEANEVEGSFGHSSPLRYALSDTTGRGWRASVDLLALRRASASSIGEKTGHPTWSSRPRSAFET